MKAPEANEPADQPDAALKAAAQAWVLRHDRGLTPAESEAFDAWLEADPRHAEAWEQSSGIWGQLDLLGATDPALLAAARPRRNWAGWLTGAAAAAALAVAYFGWWAPARTVTDPGSAVIAAAAPRMMQLADGTTVFLKAGSELVERFTNTERRVLLVRGEALFDVAKNKDWPFVVRAGTVEVRAVGTAFNVQLQSASVEVRVTEGQVRVTPDRPATAEATVAVEPPLVSAGQRAVVDLTPNARAAVQVFAMSSDQITQSKALQDPMIRLGGSTLEELAAEFQRRTGQVLVFADPELKKFRVGGQIRGDNLAGFLWLLEDNYGIKSERSSDGNLILRKAP
jgi:transmembrane sensor